MMIWRMNKNKVNACKILWQNHNNVDHCSKAVIFREIFCDPGVPRNYLLPAKFPSIVIGIVS